MNFISEMKEELYSLLTENGDKAYSTSGSYCLDFFSLCGGLRHRYTDLFQLYLKAFYENQILAIKLLFYLRDIRGGLGERNSFRFILNSLGNLYPKIANQIIDYIPQYGRFDDLFSLFDTEVEINVLRIIKKQLKQDQKNYNQNKEISLLSKWLPSINTSNRVSRSLANKICTYLEYTHEEYRKILSKLRKGRVLEVYLSASDYSFDYSKQPSQALFRYSNAFARNDKDKYLKFLEQSVLKNNLNTSTLYPYQIVQKIRHNGPLSDEDKMILDATWTNIDRSLIDSRTIVVLDGSGSMYFASKLAPIDIAMSLAILFSEQLTGPYQNTFITFSENPKLVELKSKTIYDKVYETLNFNEVANTNISKVYDLILKTAIKNKVNPVDLPQRIVIISDMEFDSCVEGMSTFEVYKNKFNQEGFTLPELVFWNVEARNIHLPVKQNEANIKLVSGASKNIIEMITNNTAFNPYDYMLKILSKYQEFDNLII